MADQSSRKTTQSKSPTRRSGSQSQSSQSQSRPKKRSQSRSQSQLKKRSQTQPQGQQSQPQQPQPQQPQPQQPQGPPQPPRSRSQDLVSRIGSLEVDWPRSAGYFGGVALAVGAGLIEPPLGAFIVAIPFIKMLDLPGLNSLPRFVAQIFEGVAKPVGGDSEGTVRIVTPHGASDQPVQQSG